MCPPQQCGVYLNCHLFAPRENKVRGFLHKVRYVEPMKLIVTPFNTPLVHCLTHLLVYNLHEVPVYLYMPCAWCIEGTQWIPTI